MSLTLVEQTILDTFPQAWLEQAQRADAIRLHAMGVQGDYEAAPLDDELDERTEMFLEFYGDGPNDQTS